jgi:class 3 adenylate cyclase/predicted ATPase
MLIAFQKSGGPAMKFYEVVEQVIALLQREGRVSYRALKREFALEEEYLEDLKEELITAKRLASDEDGKILVWLGGGTQEETENRRNGESENISLVSSVHSLEAKPTGAERRQLTVMFCDLVGSTTLSEQLDPEDLREVVRAYQMTCAEIIERFEGHIAQYLGDGLLVYFGYPGAHEDDAQRAVRAGLEIVATLQKQIPSPFVGEGQGEGAAARAPVVTPSHPAPFDAVYPEHSRRAQGKLPSQAGKEKLSLIQRLQIRIGIHTGLVVVGEMGGGSRREQLALGDTPNIAARLQGLAEPDTVVVSAATYRLIQGYFACQDLGSFTLKNVSAPVSVHRVVEERSTQSRFEVAVSAGLTPLVGREEEMRQLLACWERVKAGEGQVVLLCGEPGIGKSRLVQELKEQVTREGYTRIEFRCSPYYQNTAFYPVIEHLQRLLQFRREDSVQEKLAKLERMLQGYRLPVHEVVPLFAALLSLPHPEGYPPLTLTPQRQRQKTQEALWAWLLEEAERKPLLAAWEDLHWADPSTLELHTLFLGQAPTARILTVLTCRPEFSPPWGVRSHLTQITLSRLGRPQVEAMLGGITGRMALPAEVIEQVVSKTDGVPLFVEELTKMVLESGLLRAEEDHYALIGPLPPLAIPTTLQDSLMARLDRLAPVREVVQLGATLGREFSYELLQAVAPWDEATLQRGLAQLVDAELLYQRELPPQARYFFKHALIQETAYHSVLKSKRQHYHQKIVQVLEERFTDVVETQPELLAHHYTEAGLIAPAIPYWQRAGQQAVERSANIEAISHLAKGIELLKTLPDTLERAEQELSLQMSLGVSLQAIKGQGNPEVEKAYARAQDLCRVIGAPTQLSPVLGLFRFYFARADLQRAYELAEQLLHLAQNRHDPALLIEAHRGLATALCHLGEQTSARKHFEQGIALYEPQQHSTHAFLYGQDPGVTCLSYLARVLWLLGYPDQALKKSHEALILARGLSHPLSLAIALQYAAVLHQFRREEQLTQEQAGAAIEICTEQKFPFWLAISTVIRGWALAEQGQPDGVIQMSQGLALQKATGAGIGRSLLLGLLAEGYEKGGQVEEGLTVLTEALAWVHRTGERYCEAELYRRKGELTLKRLRVQGAGSRGQEETEVCFQQAVAIARRQSAKSLELRAAMSLARLWQQQGKKDAARQLLVEVYGWFTEGFDTADLKEAKALLDELTAC